MVYIYSNHLSGGLFISENNIDDECLYCDECGDSDRLEMSSDNIHEIGAYLRSQLNVFNCGGFSMEYLEEIWQQCIDILEPAEDDYNEI